MSLVILIAEDHTDDALLLSLALEKAGIRGRVVRVSDGIEAMQYLEGSAPFADREKWPYPSLLLLDLKMPRVSGFEVLEWLARRKDLPALHVVAITGLEHPDDVLRVQGLGAQFCISKGICHQEIAAALACVANALLTGHGWSPPPGLASSVSLPPPNLISFPAMPSGPMPGPVPA